MEENQTGSKAYLISIVMVAVLGGLLFGYDTAVISGAEKGLQAFFKGAKDFTYSDGWHGFTCASALIGCIIGSSISGVLASNWGRKRSLIFAGVMFFISALGSMDPEFMIFQHGTPTFSLLIAFNIYRVIGGVGVGLASAICPMYIGEVAPSQHSRYAGFMESVCHHFRSVSRLLRQFHYTGLSMPILLLML
jgi:SP family xylose:H+ symportor-like MFS transporter